MVSTTWIYSIQFEFWSLQLHQHLSLHSTCHINNKTYAITPDLHWHQYLHLCILYRLLDSCNLYKHLHFVHATLYITTFPVYPLLTTSTLCWIITNASTTDTTGPSYSLLHYLLPFPTNHNLGFIHIYSHASILHVILQLIKPSALFWRVAFTLAWSTVHTVIVYADCRCSICRSVHLLYFGEMYDCLGWDTVWGGGRWVGESQESCIRCGSRSPIRKWRFFLGGGVCPLVSFGFFSAFTLQQQMWNKYVKWSQYRVIFFKMSLPRMS